MLAPPDETIPKRVPLDATLLEKNPPLALPNWLLLIFNAVTTAPVLDIPCIWPLAADEEKFLRIFELIFSVPAAPEFVIPAIVPVVAVVAVMAFPIILLPVILTVPAADKFVIAVKPFVVDVAPPSTQF